MLLTSRQFEMLKLSVKIQIASYQRQLHAEQHADKIDHESVAYYTTAITTLAGVETHLARLAPSANYILTVTSTPEAVS